MARPPAAEAKFLFDATFTLFQGKLSNLDGVDDHSVRVVVFGS